MTLLFSFAAAARLRRRRRHPDLSLSFVGRIYDWQQQARSVLHPIAEDPGVQYRDPGSSTTTSTHGLRY